MTAETTTETVLSTQIDSFGAQALAIRVIDQPTAVSAAGILKTVKGARKSVVDYFKDIKASAHETWKGICGKEGAFLKRLEPIEAHLSQQIGAYSAEVERKRIVEQARLDAEQAAAQKKIDDARKAEEARLAAEQRAEQARLDAIAEAQRKAEQAERDRLAAKAKADGDAAEAARIAALPKVEVVAQVAAPVAVLPPVAVLQRSVAQVEKPAIPTRTVWEFEVTDAAAVPREFLMVNETAIRERVQLLKGGTMIAGVRVSSREVPIVRGAK